MGRSGPVHLGPKPYWPAYKWDWAGLVRKVNQQAGQPVGLIKIFQFHFFLIMCEGSITSHMNAYNTLVYDGSFLCIFLFSEKT